MTPNLYIDLDGTLLECRRRLHGVFVRVSGIDSYSVDEYWNIKRVPHPNRWFLHHAGWSIDAIERFEREWLELIEDDAFLDMDTLHAGVPEALERLRSRFTLTLLTARQSPDAVTRQLTRLGVHSRFDTVIATGLGRTKSQVLALRSTASPPGSWLIGDTSEDVKVARGAGLSAATIENGFRRREYLADYMPNASFADFVACSAYLLDP